MFLKRRVWRKDGKDHVYSVRQSLRVHGGSILQRQVLHLGGLNPQQQQSWQHTLEVINDDDDGRRMQQRLFTDREGDAPTADDVIELRSALLANVNMGDLKMDD